jgi:Dyp-type peroxidase family
MRKRAGSIGDVGASAPKHWDGGLRGTHLVIALTALQKQHDVGEFQRKVGLSSADGTIDATGETLLRLPAIGLTVTHTQAAAALPDSREHFGFNDGFSQPAIAGANTGRRDGEGVLVLGGGWRDLAIGEFVLGPKGEGGLPAPAPRPPLDSHATFMVIRKLEQDVAVFRSYVEARASELCRKPEWVASRMIGRWPNGSAVVRHPDDPGPPAGDTRKLTNKFGYSGDLNGVSCPLGAHVRRANPRDALGWQSRLSMRHRILRRGISYGPALEQGRLEDDGQERGLMFVCFQSSLERQFEFVQRQWLGDGNVFGLGSDRDPLLAGGGSRQHVIQGRPPRYLKSIPSFVRTRGGDYYLYPGRPGLEALVNGTW